MNDQRWSCNVAHWDLNQSNSVPLHLPVLLPACLWAQTAEVKIFWLRNRAAHITQISAAWLWRKQEQHVNVLVQDFRKAFIVSESEHLSQQLRALLLDSEVCCRCFFTEVQSSDGFYSSAPLNDAQSHHNTFKKAEFWTNKDMNLKLLKKLPEKFTVFSSKS